MPDLVSIRSATHAGRKAGANVGDDGEIGFGAKEGSGAFHLPATHAHVLSALQELVESLPARYIGRKGMRYRSGIGPFEAHPREIDDPLFAPRTAGFDLPACEFPDLRGNSGGDFALPDYGA